MIKEANVTTIVPDLESCYQALGLKLGNQVEAQWAEIRGSGLTIGLHPRKIMLSMMVMLTRHL
jgi:hypothetical protein